MATVILEGTFEDLLNSNEEILGADEGLYEETGKQPEPALILTVGNKRVAFIIPIPLSLLEPIVQHLKDESHYQEALRRVSRDAVTAP